MKHLNPASLLLMLALPIVTQANGLQSVPLKEMGMTTAYVSIPANFTCNIKIPDEPTALCKGPGGRLYHLTGAIIAGQVNPQQYFNNLLQQIASEEPESRIVSKYELPEITQHIQQRDSQLIYRYGQQTVTYGFDVVDASDKRMSSVAVAVSVFPNNGAPATTVQIFGVTVPESEVADFSASRKEMIRFVRSYQYDQNWVQSANVQHSQFRSNLSARERNFSIQQQRIHQSNMDALDQSYKSYRDRSAASDRVQRQFVDSIHERQQFVDPTTGGRYEADGYYDYNYVKPNDPSLYYRSDDPLANPNINNNQGEDYNQLQEYNYGR